MVMKEDSSLTCDVWILNNKNMFLWNYPKKLQRNEYFWIHSVRPTLVLYENQTKKENYSPVSLMIQALHRDTTRRLILKSDWLYSLLPKMEKLYTVSKNKTGSCLWLISSAPYCKIQTQIEVGKTVQVCMGAKLLQSSLSMTLWTIACQAPLSMGF